MRKLRKLIVLSALLALIAVSFTGCYGGRSRPLGWGGVAVSGNELYFGTTNGILISLNADSGSVRWQTDLDGGQGVYGTPLVVGDTVYVTTYSGRVYAINTSGALKWTAPTVEQVKLPANVVSGLAYDQDTGDLYYGSTDGNVYAIDASTGATVWSFKTGDKVWATPIVDSGIVYVGSFDKKFYALSADDGSEMWSFEAGGVFSDAAIIAGDSVIAPCLDRNVYALDKNTGSKNWQFSGDKWFWASPLVIGDKVYAPNTDGKVYVLNSADGSKLIEYDLKDPVASSPALAGNQTVVVTTEAGSIKVIDDATQQISDLVNPLNTTLRAPVSASGDIVYIHSQTNETVYAMNAVTKAQIWQYRVP